MTANHPAYALVVEHLGEEEADRALDARQDGGALTVEFPECGVTLRGTLEEFVAALVRQVAATLPVVAEQAENPK